MYAGGGGGVVECRGAAVPVTEAATGTDWDRRGGAAVTAHRRFRCFSSGGGLRRRAHGRCERSALVLGDTALFCDYCMVRSVFLNYINVICVFEKKTDL